MAISVKLQQLNPEAIMPMYQTDMAAGFDLYYCGNETEIYPGEMLMLETGWAVELPRNFELQIRSRSGLAKSGLIVANSPGTIDADYRGEVKVLLLNTGHARRVIQHHERIAQGVIAPVYVADFEVVEKLSETERGSGGFGSTGTK